MASSGISRRTGTDGQTPIPPSAAWSSDLADLRFALVGSGRLGIALASALRHAGASLTAHTSLSAAGRERGERSLGAPASPTIADLAVRASAADTSLFVVAVPDDALPGVARALARARETAMPYRPDDDRPRPAVCHTSGATTVDVLVPLAEQGAVTFSFHPLQTFGPEADAARLRDVTVAVTAGPSLSAGDPDEGVELGFRMAHAIGARPFVLHEEDRVLYHAAACVASNYLVTLEHLAARLFTRAGLGDEDALPAFMPLVEGTIDNLRRYGTVAALTGPLSRGDSGTISRHLHALALEAPEALEPYCAMGRATLRIVRERGQVGEATIRGIDDLLTASMAAPAHARTQDPASFAPTPAADPGSPPPRRSR